MSGRDQVLEALKEECTSLSVEELAEVAGLPAWRVRAMAKQGKGPPHFKIGKLYRFPVVGSEGGSENGPTTKKKAERTFWPSQTLNQ